MSVSYRFNSSPQNRYAGKHQPAPYTFILAHSNYMCVAPHIKKSEISIKTELNTLMNMYDLQFKSFSKCISSFLYRYIMCCSQSADYLFCCWKIRQTKRHKDIEKKRINVFSENRRTTLLEDPKFCSAQNLPKYNKAYWVLRII